jgi:N-hydroxyarylamine O-acetyltransferase
LLGAALEALGFRPKRHAARVTMLVPRTDAPRTHMFLTVPIGDMTFVVDPGFGSLASRVPVPVIDGSATRPGDAMHWMLRDDRYWILRAQVGESPVDAWASTMEQENAVDFVMGSHFTATFPASPFVNRIMMRALTADGRVTVMNRDVTVWRGNESQTTQLANRADLRTLLVDYFGFDLPEVLQLRVSSIPEWQ